MFEKLIARQLMHLLGEYLEPSSFNPETVRLGVWSGYFVLDNVCLKQGLLDVAPLPVHMTHGSIARIEIRIPWSNLTQEPIELTIHGVYIVFRAEGEDKRIPGKETKEERKQAIKKARLSSAYISRIDSLENAGQQGKRLGMRFMERLIYRVLDSILIHVQGVHIRYEDAISNPLHPFCTGVTLASLYVHSTDKNPFHNSQEMEHVPSKQKDAVPRLAKTLQLIHLAAYWNAAQLGNPCSMFVGEGLEENTHNAVASIMHLLVPRPDLYSSPRAAGRRSSHLPPLGHNYLLDPVDATVNILLFEGDAQTPALWAVDAHVGSMVVSIFDWQYQDILCMIAAQTQYEARFKYSAERPCVGVMADPKAWWGYAIATAIEEVKRMKNNGMDCWDLRDIGMRRALRLEYISLWCNSINQQLGVRASSRRTAQHVVSPSHVETGNGQQSQKYCSRLEELENELSYDDIILFRAMAQEKVLSELRAQRGSKPHQEKQGTNVITSWVLWALGVHTEEGKESVDSSIPTGPTDADFEHLCDIIDWHPTEELSPAASKSDYDIERDILRLRLNFQLDCGSISVCCRDIEGFLDLRFSNLDVQCSVLGEKSDTIEVTLLLKDLGIHEIGRNGAGRMILQRRRQDPDELELLSGSLVGGEDENLFRIAVSSNVEQEHCNCDTVISIDIGQVEITLSPELLLMELIPAFLEPPIFLEYWEGLELDAANTLNSVAAQLEAKFHYFVDTHYRVLISIDAKAPLVIIPVDSGTAECITFDLGRITFNTQKLATLDPSANTIAAATTVEEQLSSSFSPSLSPSNELHFPPFHSLYDAYALNAQHVELSYIAGDGMEYTLLNPLDMNVELFVCVIPKDPAMTQLWVRGDLPEVHLRFSNLVLKHLIAACETLSRKAHTTSGGAAASEAVSRTCDLSEDERRDSRAVVSGTSCNDDLEAFLDFQRAFGEYVDHRISSNYVTLDVQEDKEGNGSALIEPIQLEEDEESFFDACSENEMSLSVCDEETSSSEKEGSFLDIEGGEQCGSNVKVPENDIFEHQNDLSSLVGEVKEESKILSSGGSEVKQSQLCDNHHLHLNGVENSYPAAQRSIAVLEHGGDCDSELCVLLKMAAAEAQTQVIGGVDVLLGDTDLPMVLGASFEKVIAARNGIDRRASIGPTGGCIPLNRDILRCTFTLPLVKIEIVRSDGRVPQQDDSIACNKTSEHNDIGKNGDNNDDEPILNVEFTGVAVGVHVRTDDARMTLSVRNFSILDCLKELRGDAPPHRTIVEEQEQQCGHPLPPLVSNKGSLCMVTSELFRPYQWAHGCRQSGDGDELKSGTRSRSNSALSAPYLYNRRISLGAVQEEGRSYDFLNLSLVISQPPEESTTTDVEKCEVSIDLNALEISIEQSSVLAVLKLFENVLGTEDDSSVGCHQDSLNQPHSVVTAGGSIKTPPQTLTSTTQNALLGRVLARLRSVRVNLGLITVYLIQQGIDIAAIGLGGARCLLKTDKNEKVHVLLKCTNLQILDLIAEANGNDDSISDDSELSQQQSHRNYYGISGSGDGAESGESYYDDLKSTPYYCYSRATFQQEVFGAMDENTPLLDVHFVTEIQELTGEERSAAIQNDCEAEAVSSPTSNLKILVENFKIVVPSPTFCERVSSYLLYGPIFSYLIGKFRNSSCLKTQTTPASTGTAETMHCIEEHLMDVPAPTLSSWQIPSGGIYIEFEMKEPLIILPCPYHAKEEPPVFFVLTFSKIFAGVTLRPLKCKEKNTESFLRADIGGSGVLMCIESALVGLSVTFEPENEGVLLPFDLKFSMHCVQPSEPKVVVVGISPLKTVKNTISLYDAMDIESTLKVDGKFLCQRLVDRLSCGKEAETLTRINAFKEMRTPPHFLFTSWSANSNLDSTSPTGVMTIGVTTGYLKFYSCNIHLEVFLDCKNYWSKCFKSIKQQYYGSLSKVSLLSHSRNGFKQSDCHRQTRCEGSGGSPLVVYEAYLSVEALEFTLFTPCRGNNSRRTFQPQPPSSCCNDANEISISQQRYYAEENRELEILNVRDMMSTSNESHPLHCRTSVAAVKMEPAFYFIVTEIEIRANHDPYGRGMMPALLSSSILKRCYKKGKEIGDNGKVLESYYSRLSLTVREAKATAFGGGDGWSTGDAEWQHRYTMQQQSNNEILSFIRNASSPPSLLHLQPLDVTQEGDDVADDRHGLIIRIWDCKSSGYGGDEGGSISYNPQEALRIQFFMGGLSIVVLPQFICYSAPTVFTFLSLLGSSISTIETKSAKETTPIITPALVSFHIDFHSTKLWLPLETNITPKCKSLLLSWCTSAAGEWKSSKPGRVAEAGALFTPFQGLITVKKCHLGICRLNKMHNADIMSLPCGDVSYLDDILLWPFSCTATFTTTLPDFQVPSQSSILLLNEFDMEMDIIEGTWQIDSSVPMDVWLVVVEPLVSIKWGGSARQSEEEKASTEAETILPHFPPPIPKENVGICTSSDDHTRHLNKPHVVYDGEANNGGGGASFTAPSLPYKEVDSPTLPNTKLEIGTIESCPIVPLSELYPWKVNVALQGMRILGLRSSYGPGGRGILKGTPVVLFELLEVKGGVLVVGNEDAVSTDTICPWSTASTWMEGRIQMDYYNRSSLAWEPFLEPWGARVDAKASWGATEQHELPHKQSHHHQQPTLRNLTPPTQVDIEATAKQVLNVNITEGLIDAIAGVLKALEKNPLHLASISCHPNLPVTAPSMLCTDDPSCDTTSLQTLFIAGMICNKTGVNIGVLCFSQQDGDVALTDVGPTKINAKTKCCSEKLIMSDRLLLAEREIPSGGIIPLEVTCTSREETAATPSTWWGQDSLLRGSQRDSDSEEGLLLHLSAHYPGYRPWRSASPLYCTQVGCQEHLLVLCDSEGAIGSSSTTTCTSIMQLYVDVRIKAGDIFITLHSALRLANQTSVPLHVSLGSFLAMSSNIDRSCQDVAADWDVIIAPGRKEPVPAPLAAVVAASRTTALSIKPIREMEQDQADAFTVFDPLTIQLPSPHIVNNKGNEKRPVTQKGENTILDLRQPVLTHYCRELIFSPRSTGGMANTITTQKMCCLASVTYGPQTGVEELLVCSPVCIRNFLAVSVEVGVSYVNEEEPKALYQQLSATTSVLPIDAGSTKMWTGCMPKDVFSFRVRVQGFEWSTECIVLPSTVEGATTLSQWSTAQKPFIDGVKGDDENDISMLCQLWVDTVNKCCKTKLRLRIEVSMDFLGVRYVTIWVPYWVVNSSGLPLQIALDKSAVGDREGHRGRSTAFSRARGNPLIEQPLSTIAANQNVPESSPVSVAPPLMMDYMTEPEEFNSRGCAFMRMRVPGASWSSPFSCDQAGIEGALEIKCQQTSTILSWLLPNEHQKGAVTQTNELVGGRGSQAFTLGLSIKVAEGGFHRTKVVTLVPRYIIVNQMGGPLQVNQALKNAEPGQKKVVEGGSITVSSGGQSPWHWPLASGPMLLRCRKDEFGCEWSGQLDPSQIGEQNLRLRNKQGHAVGLCRVDVDIQGPIIYLVFHKASPSMAPYHIENSSVYSLTFGQIGCEQLETLEPYTSCAYAWDEPLGKRLLKIVIQKKCCKPSLLGLYPLDEVRLFNAASNRKIEVIAVGPTRVLRFTHHEISSFGHDKDPPISDGKLASLSGGGDAEAEAKTETLGGSNSARQKKYQKRKRSNSFLRAISGTLYEPGTGEQPKIAMRQSQSLQTTMTHITLHVHLRGIGVSLVNATPRELLYISIGGIRVKFASEEDQLHTISVTVQHVQVDNQFLKTPYPLLLYPLNAAISNASAPPSALDILHCTNSNSSNDIGEVLRVTSIVEQSSSGEGTEFLKIFSVKLLRISLAPLDVNVDGALVMALLMMYSRAAQVLSLVDGSNSVTGRVVGQNIITAEGVLSSLSPPLLYRYRLPTLPSAKMYFEELIIDPIRVHVSFRLKGVYNTPDRVDLEDENDSSVIAVRGSTSGECYNVINGCVVASSVSARPSSSTSALILALLNSTGAHLASIENVPLSLNALVLTHTFSSTKDLGQQLTRHYQRQILFPAFKILGSVELLGNPVAFLQNIAFGVKDFLYEPVAGLRDDSMKGFVLGVIKGTSSLLKRTTYSLAEVFQLIAGKYSVFLLASGYVPLSLPSPSIHRKRGGSGLTHLSCYSATGQYVTKEKWFQPSGIFSGICLGLVGIVRDPLLGFVKGSVKGLVIGMYRGGLGLLIRPAHGGFVTVESIGKYVSQFLYPTLGPAQKQRMQRVRPPRFFSHRHQPLTIFSQEGSDAGRGLLRRANYGQHMMECYVWHEVVGTMTYLLTRQTLLILNQTDTLFNPTVEVTIPLCCIVWEEVVEEGNGLYRVGIYDVGNVGDKMRFRGLNVRYTALHIALRKTLHELLGLIKLYSQNAELLRACK